MACYLWDRKSQRPKHGVRVALAPAPPKAPAARAAAAPAPPKQRQQLLLSKVMEMGFDEPSAKRALTATGWSGVEEALNVLFGS